MSLASTLPAIQLDDLRIDRGGRNVIDTVSLSIQAGIITGLLGPSGCGKTTLMRALVGAQKITSGSAVVFDQPAGARSLRRRIGYVTQSPSIYPDLTTVENVRYFAALYGIGKQRVHEVVEAVGLTGQKTDLAGNLSGGQQGRVSLACALVCDPDLLHPRRADGGRPHVGVVVELADDRSRRRAPSPWPSRGRCRRSAASCCARTPPPPAPRPAGPPPPPAPRARRRRRCARPASAARGWRAAG